MDFEITFDPKMEAVFQGLALDYDHEVMPDGDWIRFARRVTGIPELFMYHHKRTGNFVLAKWLFKPEVCLEIEAFPVAPDRGGWMSAEELKARCKPIEETVKSMKDKMRETSSQRASMKADDAAQRREAVKMLRRRGNDREAYMIEQGMTPWVGAAKGGETYERTCETLRQLAKVT